MRLLVLLLRGSAGALALAVLCGLLSGALSARVIAQTDEHLASGGTLMDSRARGYMERLQLGHKVGSDAGGALSTTQM